MAEQTIRIYHTNDVHSRFTQFARVVAYVKENKHPEDMFLDGGDMCDLTHLIVEGTGGKGAIRIMQEAGIDAIAVGNNEIDLKHDWLEESSRLGLPMLACNVTDNEGNAIGDIKGSIIIEKAGVRFLVIGAAPYYNREMKPNGFNEFSKMSNIMTTEPIQEIRGEIAKNEGKYDICLFLSHSGVDVDKFLMDKIPEIDFCLGGHSHSLYYDEKYNQVGMFGEHLGIVELTIQNKKIVKASSQILAMTEDGRETVSRFENIEIGKIENLPEADENVLKVIEEQDAIADKNLSKPMYCVEKLEWDAKKESPMTNFIADALYKEYPCDFAFINAGIVEGGVEGDISRKVLLQLSPSKLNPTRFPVKGENFKRAVLHSLDEEFVSQSGRGPGVRGSILGTLGYSHNVQINMEPFEIFINGEILDEDREYNCMADDSLQRGTGYEEFKVPNAKAKFYDGFIRDLIERNLTDKELIQQAMKKRIE